jgi:transposase
MTAHRKRYSAHDKIELLRLHLVEQVAVPEICERHKIHPTIFYRWQRQLFSRGSLVFQGRSQTRLLANYRRKVQALKNAARHREKELQLARKQLQDKNSLAAALQKFAAGLPADVAYSLARGAASHPVALNRTDGDDESNSDSVARSPKTVTKLAL